ncbi:MAG: ribosomal subunit interface protein [Bdellovibrionales bacterium RIFOXYD12_FULL_39_22]|nr:MAG: ribosomal subunit interface protein [Bdellovibrionales bacterium RIFOXYB1_FULL_39_21]OFZ43102.1 MAG: ribosomal subunit interface protein [Bdellovibrionales bacterium RIFOXYC12_FULL_39_17]OFZ47840.1 MAG: ribosomal subunit interface protein [Bdellovibrionales bacterium RIFOXYC1_FULL_39_130]OFZ68806.1 MAG: ribosomal subunit interface protein [Bdellovibrionales bacterium RIFOXYC2_FULL_39_8]OFZ75620.1 MAG: ribosomal subunit interface protein [Bdellovibrionales bacterium RIFOXYD1_FULL_39_84]
MNVTITFKHMEHTPALDERIREKSKKLERYFHGNSNVKWTCYTKEGKHFSEVDVSGARFSYHASAGSDNLYKSFDLVIGKIERQVEKKQQIGKDHIHHHAEKNKEVVILDPDMAWTDHDEDNLGDAG